MSIQFIPSLPHEMSPSVPMSSSDFIAARREKIFLPDQQTTYSFEGNDRLTFTLNSNNEMVDGQNSWIEFDLAVVGVGADLNATQLTQRVIDAGGAHALFRRLQITLSNGTQIEDISEYNKLYSIIRHNTMSENHVRYVEHVSGDGMVGEQFESQQYPETCWRDITYVVGEANYVVAGTNLILAAAVANASAKTELAVGDIIRIGTAVLNYTARVTAITDNRQVVVEGVPAAAIAAGAILSLKVSKPAGVQSARYRAASTNAIKLKFKPFSNFLQNSKFVPLMFLKNLQFNFELERGALAFKLLAAPGAGASITYTISNPRFVAQMITPSEMVLQGMLEAYNSSEGLYHPFLSYQHHMKLLAAGDAVATIPSNCRSAVAIVCAQYPEFGVTVTADSYVNDTISTTIKNRVDSFQFKIGSENYPYGRSVDCADIYNGEALTHVQRALDLHGNVLYSNSMVPSDYWAINTVAGQTDESKRFVMAVPLSRDMSSEACGVDLISNDVQLEMTKSAAGLAVYLRSFIIFNSALKISRASTIVFK